MARRGLRTLAVAYRRLPPELGARCKTHADWHAAITNGEVETDLTVLGILGLQV